MDTIWFCSACGNGPQGVWECVCSCCSHLKCIHCREEIVGKSIYRGREGIHAESVGMHRSLQVPRLQSVRSTYPKHIPDAAQSGRIKTTQSTEDAKNSLEKKDLSIIKDNKSGAKDEHRLMMNDLHKLQIGSEDQRERHGLRSQAQPTQGDLVLLRKIVETRPERASEQALSSHTVSDSKMKPEPHTGHTTIDPETDTADRSTSFRLSESLFDTPPSSPRVLSGDYPWHIEEIEVEQSNATGPVDHKTSSPTVIHEASKFERTSVLDTNSVDGGGDDDDEIDRYCPETIPASPSYASSVTSVFSAGSLASSATNLSRSSGYSAVQIASAAKVLLSVLQEDASLLPLYKNAMNNPYIGPDRLRRNLRRIFKAYSRQLESEAKERLEFLTSRLVMVKSGLLADSIVEKLQTAQVTHLVSNVEHRDESSDEDGDEGSGTYPVNEEAFEDLEVFREFLVMSEAFQNLHMQVQVFVTGKSKQTVDANTMESEKLPSKDALQQCHAMSAAQARMSLTWENWIEDVKQTTDGLLRDTSITKATNSLMLLFTEAFMLAIDGILIALGQLEPALRPGWTRLRWRCSCGDHLYSDVLELRAGGISELTGHMQRTSGVKVHVSSYDQQNSVQQYIAPHPVKSIQNAGRKICVALSRATQLSTLLPQYNTQCHANASTTPTNNISTTSSNNASCTSNCNASSTSNSNASSISSGNASSTPNNNAPQQNTLRLLACMHRDREYVGLIQDPLENVTTDQTLLCFLRRQYVCHRGSILRMVSLKGIKGLHLVKFWLTKGGKVIVGHHEQYCAAASSASMLCECLPPVSKVEPSPGAQYRCRPVPPKTNPPIPPKWLSHVINCPADMDEDDTLILNQLPKRTCGKLQGQIGEAVEGWGVYYEEDWDHDMIMLAILILLFVASLLFCVLWSRFKLDIQGAFGVSSWITAVCTVFLVVVANYADKKR